MSTTNKTYTVKLQTTSYRLVEACDHDHALARAEAVERHGRENTDIHAIEATIIDSEDLKGW